MLRLVEKKQDLFPSSTFVRGLTGGRTNFSTGQSPAEDNWWFGTDADLQEWRGSQVIGSLNSSEETCSVIKVIQICFCYKDFIMEKCNYSLSLQLN